MLLLGFGDQLAVLTNYSAMEVKKSWQKTVLYEDKSNPQLEFNKMQKGSDRISSTSQAIQTGSHSVLHLLIYLLPYLK